MMFKGGPISFGFENSMMVREQKSRSRQSAPSGRYSRPPTLISEQMFKSKLQSLREHFFKNDYKKGFELVWEIKTDILDKLSPYSKMEFFLVVAGQHLLCALTPKYEHQHLYKAKTFYDLANKLLQEERTFSAELGTQIDYVLECIKNFPSADKSWIRSFVTPQLQVGVTHSAPKSEPLPSPSQTNAQGFSNRPDIDPSLSQTIKQFDQPQFIFAYTANGQPYLINRSAVVLQPCQLVPLQEFEARSGQKYAQNPTARSEQLSSQTSENPSNRHLQFSPL